MLAGEEGFDLASQPFGLSGGPSPLGSVVRIPSSPGKSKTPTCHRHMSVSLWLGMRDSTYLRQARKFAITSTAGIGTFPCELPLAVLTPIL